MLRSHLEGADGVVLVNKNQRFGARQDRELKDIAPSGAAGSGAPRSPRSAHLGDVHLVDTRKLICPYACVSFLAGLALLRVPLYEFSSKENDHGNSTIARVE